MTLQPARCIAQQGKAGGVRLGKTITTKTLYLFKQTLCKVQLVVIVEHALNKFLFKAHKRAVLNTV